MDFVTILPTHFVPYVRSYVLPNSRRRLDAMEKDQGPKAGNLGGADFLQEQRGCAAPP